MGIAKHTNSKNSATKRGKAAWCLFPAVINYKNCSAKTGKIDTLKKLTMDQPLRTPQTVESSILRKFIS